MFLEHPLTTGKTADKLNIEYAIDDNVIYKALQNFSFERAALDLTGNLAGVGYGSKKKSFNIR
jgi:hypothetical protein